MKKLVLLVISMALALTGCSGGTSPMDLTTKEFSAKVGEQNVVVLDVRTPDEFSAGHLHNAINIDVESGTFSQKISTLDKNATYAVYCRSGRRSGIAVSQMKDAGFTSLFNLSGGIIDWAAQGLPIEVN